MKTSKIIAVAALSLAAVAGVQAEEYQGVHAPTSQLTRSEVSSAAVVAAHTANPYAEGAYSVPQPVTSVASRSAVREQAYAAAHDPFQSVDKREFYNSVLPAQYTQGSLAIRRANRMSAKAAAANSAL